MDRILVNLLTLLGLLFTCVSSSPVRKRDVDIYSFHINSTVTSRYAMTVITSRVANRLNESKEIHFEVKIPKNAFISRFRMTIEGKMYDGVVKEKEEAKQQYSEAVSRGESAGMVSSVGRTLEEFKTSVMVAALSKVTFELTYEELLKRRLGQYELLINAQPMQPVADFKIDVYINERSSLSLLGVKGRLKTEKLSDALTSTLANTAKEAWVTFYPTREQQTNCCGEEGLKGDLIIFYDVKRQKPSGELQTSNGYFVHYFAPTDLTRIPKNVVFVIDRSGSMRGTKMAQTRSALLKILGDLGEEDFFGLITFDSRIDVWKHELHPATEKKLAKARVFVQNIEERGATDINGAVLKGVDMIRQFPREGTASILILLTDGDPTSGETNTSKIQKNIQEAIGGKFPLYCLGFGYDVNFDFLNKMALENSGLARRIYEDSDADLQLQGFYEEVATPLLTDVQLKYSGAANLTKSSFGLYYNGSEIVVAGQITDNSLESLHTEVIAISQSRNVTYQDSVSTKDLIDVLPQHEDFIQRLWAYLTVKQLLEKKVTLKGEEKEAANKKALELSLKYKFVTPLTSMVVTKPQEGETQVAHKPKEGEPVHQPFFNQPNQRNRGSRYKIAHSPAGSHPVQYSYRASAYPQMPVSSYSRQVKLHAPDIPVVADNVLIQATFHTVTVDSKVHPTYASAVRNARFLITAQPKTLCYDVPVGQNVRIMSCPTLDILLNGWVSEKGFDIIRLNYQGSSHNFSFADGKISMNYLKGPETGLASGPLVSIELKNDAAIINVGGLRVYINAFQQDGDMFMWPKIQTLNNNTTCLLDKGSVQYEELQGLRIKIGDEEVQASLSMATDYRISSAPIVNCWLVPLQFIQQKSLQFLIE